MMMPDGPGKFRAIWVASPGAHTTNPTPPAFIGRAFTIMTNTTIPPQEGERKFRASVDASFLDKVSRIFDASPLTVFNEMLQNARRAGARRVTVHLSVCADLKKVSVRFIDDGRGVDSPEVLLRLAGSQWEQNVSEREDPAGMGFFCLSRCENVVVKSRNWVGEFTAGVFSGQEDLIMREVSEDHYVTGMEVSWDWTTTASEVVGAITRASRYCGLDSVTIDRCDVASDGCGGWVVSEPAKVESIIPVSYLHDCNRSKELPDLGVTIGLRYWDHSHDSGHGTFRGGFMVNFHGVQIQVYGGEAGTEHLMKMDGHFDRSFEIKVDVSATHDLQLVLPARNALMHTPGRDRLMLECERFLFECIVDKTDTALVGNRGHRFPFSVYQRGIDVFGIDIGEARPCLTSRARYTEVDCSTANVLLSYVEDNQSWGVRAFEHAVVSAVGDAGYIVCRPRRAMQGYSWYDSLPRIGGVRILVDGTVYNNDNDLFGGDVSADLRARRPKDSIFAKVDSIVIEVDQIDADGVTNEILSRELPALMVAYDNYAVFDDIDLDGTIVLLTPPMLEMKGSSGRSAMDDMRYVLFDFDNSVDGDDDPYDTFSVAFTSAYFEFLGDAVMAARNALQGGVDRASLEDILTPGWAWSLHYDPRASRSCAMLVGPHEVETMHRRRVYVTVMDRNLSANTYELVSDTDITNERVEEFLRQEHAYDPSDGDSYTMTPAAIIPTDLDAAERKRGKELEDE